MASRLEEVDIRLIRENKDALRQVNKESIHYAELLASIREIGVTQPILLTEREDENKNKYFLLADGLHRFSASKEAGRPTIPAQIMDLDENQVYFAQIIGNVHKIETKPIEYTKQIKRILGNDPLMTMRDLAIKLGKSSAWLDQRLSLTRLEKTIQDLVNDDKIPLANAYQLAKLPPEEQPQWVDSAVTKPAAEFATEIAARVKAIKDANSTGRSASPAGFQAVRYFRKRSEVETLLDNPSEIELFINRYKLTNPMDTVKVVLEWMTKTDPITLAQRRAEWDAEQSKKAEAKAAREAERAEKKKQEGAKTAALATAE